MEWHIIGILAIVVIYNIYRYYHENNSSDGNAITNALENDPVKEVKMEEKAKTRELATATLRSIGTEPRDTEEGRIQFDYQGITFLLEAVDECLFVNLIWPWCHSFSKFDIDEFARVRQVVNEINMRGTVSVFYGITDSDDVALHIKKHFLLVPQIDDLEGYMKIILDSFFRTARTLDLEIEKCRMQEYVK